MKMSADPRSGIDEAGRWLPAFAGQRPPFEKDNLAALSHGANSDRQIRPLARNQQRRFLRQVGLRASDIDPVGKAYLWHYCSLTAKVVLLDRYLDLVGLLDEQGNPRPCMALYVRLQNAAMVALGKLERHLEVREPNALEALYEHLRDVSADG
jgi:hypothetical protein